MSTPNPQPPTRPDDPGAKRAVDDLYGWVARLLDTIDRLEQRIKTLEDNGN